MIVGTTMLCSVAEYRRYAQIEGTEFDTLNSLLVDQIAEQTQRIWKRLGGDQSSQWYNDSYDVDDWDQDYIVPDHAPVLQVAAMTLYVPGTSDTAVDADEIWFDDYRIGVVERFGRIGSGLYQDVEYMGTGRKLCKVCYQAGRVAQELKPLVAALKAEVSAWLNANGYEGMIRDNQGLQYESSGWTRQAESILGSW